MEKIEYRKSTFSGAECCVEVGILPDGTAHVRDTKDPAVVLTFSAAEWAAFMAGARAGEFG